MLLPARVEDYVGHDALVRVIEAFAVSLDLVSLGFIRAVPATQGRPGYDPRDLLRLYLYGYLNGVRSSRRLERECHVNVEVMWLMAKRAPDFKTIADFRRDNGPAIVGCGQAFVRFCRDHGLFAGTIAAIDGTKLRACASARRIMSAAELAIAQAEVDREITGYLEALDVQDAQEPPPASGEAVQAALARLQRRGKGLADLAEVMADEARKLGVEGEADARPMGHGSGPKYPSYNVQIAVDPQSHIIVHHEVTTQAGDNALLAPMAEATQAVLEQPGLTVVADAGYGTPAQAAACEAAGITPTAPAIRYTNPRGTFFTAQQFVHDLDTDTLRCPAGRVLTRNGSSKRYGEQRYRARDCTDCPLKPQCTTAPRRYVYRHIHAAAAQRMNQRADAAMMRLRRCTAELPFAGIKQTLAGRFLLRGKAKAATETALAVLAYNIIKARNLLGSSELQTRLA